MLLKHFILIVFTLIITFTITFAANEEDTDNRAQNPFIPFGGTQSPQTYYFGYDSKVKDAPRLMRQETRLSDGTVTGRYGYTDPFGVFRVVKYVSGSNGYFASEEIGEQVTSSTPLYYKATAAQVDGVSEIPLSYTHDLATRFNPPLYHPEAHTMEYSEIEDMPSTLAPNDGDGDNRRSHQIFSLSNSEDILEKKYRERIQLKNNLQNNQNNQNQKRVNFVPKQTLDKRFGDNKDRDFDSNNNTETNEKIIEFSEHQNYNNKPLNENINEENFRRIPIIGNNLKHILNKNESNVKNNSNIRYERPLNTEKLVLESNTSAIDDTYTGTTERIPNNVRHLYYNPTRSPVMSYSTSVSRVIHEVISDSQNNRQSNGIWNKIRERFIFSDSKANDSASASLSTDSTDTIRDHTFTSTTADPIVHQNDNKTEDIVPVFVRAGVVDIEPISEDIVEEEEPKYLDKNYFFENKNFVSIERLINDLPIDRPLERQISDLSSNENTTKIELSVNNDNNSVPIEHIETTSISDIEITTETALLESTTITPNDNLRPDLTKSAFFHHIWSDFDTSVENKWENIDNSSHVSIPETPELINDGKTTEPLMDSSDNRDKPLMNSTNRQQSHDFWYAFNEKAILYSEAKSDNMSSAPVVSHTAHDKTDGRSPMKHIMYSTAQLENKTFLTTETTDINTDSNENSITTTTTPMTTSIESKDNDNFDHFWHKFNDNSDEYLITMSINETISRSDDTQDIRPSETTTEDLLRDISNENSTKFHNSLNTNERQDLETLENSNHLTRIQSNSSRGLPSIDSNHQKQYIPPLSALFGFPHMRKRVRRVQRLSTKRPVLRMIPNDDIITTSTSAPIDSQTEGLDVLSVEESSDRRTFASDYQYMPPFAVLRQSVAQNSFESQKGLQTSEEYYQPFDDMSEIVTTIQSMRKPIVSKSEVNKALDKTMSAFGEKIVLNDHKRDNLENIRNTPEFRDNKQFLINNNNNHLKPQPKYLFPLEPITDSESDDKLHQFISNDPDIHTSYEPPLRMNV